MNSKEAVKSLIEDKIIFERDTSARCHSSDTFPENNDSANAPKILNIKEVDQNSDRFLVSPKKLVLSVGQSNISFPCDRGIPASRKLHNDQDLILRLMVNLFVEKAVKLESSLSHLKSWLANIVALIQKKSLKNRDLNDIRNIILSVFEVPSLINTSSQHTTLYLRNLLSDSKKRVIFEQIIRKIRSIIVNEKKYNAVEDILDSNSDSCDNEKQTMTKFVDSIVTSLMKSNIREGGEDVINTHNSNATHDKQKIQHKVMIGHFDGFDNVENNISQQHNTCSTSSRVSSEFNGFFEEDVENDSPDMKDSKDSEVVVEKSDKNNNLNQCSVMDSGDEMRGMPPLSIEIPDKGPTSSTNGQKNSALVEQSATGNRVSLLTTKIVNDHHIQCNSDVHNSQLENDDSSNVECLKDSIVCKVDAKHVASAIHVEFVDKTSNQGAGGSMTSSSSTVQTLKLKTTRLGKSSSPVVCGGSNGGLNSGNGEFVSPLSSAHTSSTTPSCDITNASSVSTSSSSTTLPPSNSQTACMPSSSSSSSIPPSQSKEMVVPEKASSFKIHPDRCCSDVCHYCSTRFGILDTPLHLSQLKMVNESIQQFVCRSASISVDACLCDKCFRLIDRIVKKRNQSQSMNNNNFTTSTLPPRQFDAKLLNMKQHRKKLLANNRGRLCSSATNSVENNDDSVITKEKGESLPFSSSSSSPPPPSYSSSSPPINHNVVEGESGTSKSTDVPTNSEVHHEVVKNSLQNPTKITIKVTKLKECSTTPPDTSVIIRNPPPSSSSSHHKDEGDTNKQQKLKGEGGKKVASLPKKQTSCEKNTSGNSCHATPVTTNNSISNKSVVAVSQTITTSTTTSRTRKRRRHRDFVSPSPVENLSVDFQKSKDESEHDDERLSGGLGKVGNTSRLSLHLDTHTKRLWQEMHHPYGSHVAFLRHLILLEKYWRNGDLIINNNDSQSTTSPDGASADPPPQLHKSSSDGGGRSKAISYLQSVRRRVDAYTLEMKRTHQELSEVSLPHFNPSTPTPPSSDSVGIDIEKERSNVMQCTPPKIRVRSDLLHLGLRPSIEEEEGKEEPSNELSPTNEELSDALKLIQRRPIATNDNCKVVDVIDPTDVLPSPSSPSLLVVNPSTSLSFNINDIVEDEGDDVVVEETCKFSSNNNHQLFPQNSARDKQNIQLYGEGGGGQRHSVAVLQNILQQQKDFCGGGGGGGVGDLLTQIQQPSSSISLSFNNSIAEVLSQSQVSTSVSSMADHCPSLSSSHNKVENERGKTTFNTFPHTNISNVGGLSGRRGGGGVTRNNLQVLQSCSSSHPKKSSSSFNTNDHITQSNSKSLSSELLTPISFNPSLSVIRKRKAASPSSSMMGCRSSQQSSSYNNMNMRCPTNQQQLSTLFNNRRRNLAVHDANNSLSSSSPHSSSCVGGGAGGGGGAAGGGVAVKSGDNLWNGGEGGDVTSSPSFPLLQQMLLRQLQQQQQQKHPKVVQRSSAVAGPSSSLLRRHIGGGSGGGSTSSAQSPIMKRSSGASNAQCPVNQAHPLNNSVHAAASAAALASALSSLKSSVTRSAGGGGGGRSSISADGEATSALFTSLLNHHHTNNDSRSGIGGRTSSSGSNNHLRQLTMSNSTTLATRFEANRWQQHGLISDRSGAVQYPSSSSNNTTQRSGISPAISNYSNGLRNPMNQPQNQNNSNSSSLFMSSFQNMSKNKRR